MAARQALLAAFRARPSAPHSPRGRRSRLRAHCAGPLAGLSPPESLCKDCLQRAALMATRMLLPLLTPPLCWLVLYKTYIDSHPECDKDLVISRGPGFSLLQNEDQISGFLLLPGLKLRCPVWAPSCHTWLRQFKFKSVKMKLKIHVLRCTWHTIATSRQGQPVSKVTESPTGQRCSGACHRAWAAAWGARSSEVTACRGGLRVRSHPSPDSNLRQNRCVTCICERLPVEERTLGKESRVR